MQIRQYTVTSEKSDRSGRIGTGSHYEVEEEFVASVSSAFWVGGLFLLEDFFFLTYLRFKANTIRYFVL